VNLGEKLARQQAGGWFEWPNMVALNWAVASLVGSARHIAELGGGTGCFAHEAGADPKRKIVCSELDQAALLWAKAHRSRPNIEYVDRMLTPGDGPFDLVVAVDVIEHLSRFQEFLELCTKLAPRAILTTPNRARDSTAMQASPPAYAQHVREWTCGEFYWVLRVFYRSVRMYSMPNPYVPQVVPVRIDTRLTPLIAVCEQPL